MRRRYGCACGCDRVFIGWENWDGYHGPDGDRRVDTECEPSWLCRLIEWLRGQR